MRMTIRAYVYPIELQSVVTFILQDYEWYA
jgi:hypothetical protein